MKSLKTFKNFLKSYEIKNNFTTNHNNHTKNFSELNKVQKVLTILLKILSDFVRAMKNFCKKFCQTGEEGVKKLKTFFSSPPT